MTWVDSDKPFSSDRRFADYELVDQDMANILASQEEIGCSAKIHDLLYLHRDLLLI